MGSWPLWPWPLTLTFCMDITSVIAPENFRMIRWEEHCQNGVTDGQTGRRTDRQREISVLRAAWSQLKIADILHITFSSAVFCVETGVFWFEFLIDHKSVLIQIVYWRGKGHKPLPEPLMTMLDEVPLHSPEPIMQWGIRQFQSMFKIANHKRVLSCLIPHWQSYYHQIRTV